MHETKYFEGSHVKRFASNGVITVEGTGITGIEQAKPRWDSIFIVEDYVRTTDTWEGDALPEHEWRPGTVAFLPAGTELRSTPEHPYRENVVSLDSELLIGRVRAYLDTNEIETRYADVTSEDTTGVARLLHQLVSSGEWRAWPLLTDSLVLALTVAVARKFNPAFERELAQKNKQGLSEVRIKRVMDFVEARLSETIRLEEMAATASLSPYHFTRSFKKAMGVPPSRFVMERRLRHAQMLLQTSAMTLAAIAHECGFASQSHFTSAFKAAIGITPAIFRATLMS